MMTSEDAKNETLLPCDVHAQHRALGTCARHVQSSSDWVHRLSGHARQSREILRAAAPEMIIKGREWPVLLAGAKAVIASLWPAADTFTIALMKRMYQHLADRADKDIALRQAKLDLLKEFGDLAHPIYWAGFTLVGGGSTAIFK